MDPQQRLLLWCVVGALSGRARPTNAAGFADGVFAGAFHGRME